MHQYKVFITASILLLSILVKGQQQDGSVFERRVTLNQTNQPLSYILEQISWQAEVFFSYDASLINSQQTFTIDQNNKSLYTVLNQLFDPSRFKFRELENQIIITRKLLPKSITEIEQDTIQPKYFFLTGKLIDVKKDKPVTYASVSILNKPIGTISNADGDFLLKIHPSNMKDTVVISCMGYAQITLPAQQILDEDIFMLKPISIRLREVKVTAITPEELLENVRKNKSKNYSSSIKLTSAFYRETVKQDGSYINVSEAVMEILKAPYVNTFREDIVRLIKGRKSPDVQPFRWLNFKLQGGPFTITKLDVVKTVESFVNPVYEADYKYEISKVIQYNNRPVYVVNFYPKTEDLFPGFIGEMYIERESFAIVHASFKFNKHSLKEAESIMIRKKPRKVKARPSYVHYRINYKKYQGEWHLSTARASVKFKIRSKRDRLNSEFHSVSDLLITDINNTEIKRFTNGEKFTKNDVFVERLGHFDEKFWENYNIIKPDEDLRKAFKTDQVKR